jgi:putative FmdB family regulatory protein
MIYCAIQKSARRVSVPLYEYKCLKCGRRTEKIENVAGPYLKKCPHCGGKVETLISASSIQFKGSGWYVTDYAGKKPAGSDGSKEEKPAAAAEKKDTASKDSTAKESGTKETSTTEKKSEKTAKKK